MAPCCDEKYKIVIDRSFEKSISITIREKLMRHLKECPACEEYYKESEKWYQDKKNDYDPSKRLTDLIITRRSSFFRVFTRFFPFILIVVVVALVIPMIRDKRNRELLNPNNTLITEDLKRKGITASDENFILNYSDKSQNNLELKDLRYSRTSNTIYPDSEIKIAFVNMELKYFLHLFVLDENFNLQRITTGKESFILPYRIDKGTLDALTFKPARNLEFGQVVIVGFWTFKSEPFESIDFIINEWNKLKVPLKELFSFEKNDWSIRAFLLNYSKR